SSDHFRGTPSGALAPSLGDSLLLSSLLLWCPTFLVHLMERISAKTSIFVVTLHFLQNAIPYQSNTCDITKMQSDNIDRIVLLRMIILENDTQLHSAQRYFIGLETRLQTFC
ncbi:MAG TPA: hypothetical protein IAB87_01875, partial [Candidatus Coprenecus merdipullorum]|nr:hypothetical protein [Candidatus Coprenecus merdipullorum]